MKKLFVGIAAAMVSLPLTFATVAQSADTITVVLPASAGGIADAFTRAVAKEMADGSDAQVIVDNRPGGSNLIAAQYVATQPVDGNTLLVGNGTLMSILPLLRKEMPIDVAATFDPVAFLVSYPMGLVVNASQVKATNLDEFRAEALEKPGDINIASVGQDSTSYLLSQLYQDETGTELTPIPYSGDAEIVVALLSGEVDAAIVSLGVYNDHIRNGTLKLLAVNTPERVGAFPDIQTFAEQGLQKMTLPAWSAYFVRSGTPEARKDELAALINNGLAKPEVRELMVNAGTVPLVLSRSELENWIATERETWGAVVKSAGIEPK